jgi:glycosyltransferase involved in cell wall biosynthesis
MGSKEIVSIIILTKNEMGNIKALIKSIYEQSYRPIEVLIVNEGSADGTLEAVEIIAKECLSRDFIIRVLKEGDYGPLSPSRMLGT